MTKPSVILSVFLLCFVVNFEAWGCSCGRWSTPEAHIANTDVIFKGRVIKTSFPYFGKVTTTFEVSDIFKGELSGEVARVHHRTRGGGDCSVSFVKNEVVIVFAGYDKGVLRTSLCSFARADGDYPEAWGESD